MDKPRKPLWIASEPMNQSLLNALNAWVANTPDIEIVTSNTVGDDLVTLKWKRPSGDFAYIDAFPDRGEVVIVQHGTIATSGQREQRGVARFRCSDLAKNLARLKSTLDLAEPVKRWTYKPDVEIGSVSSLKLR